MQESQPAGTGLRMPEEHGAWGILLVAYLTAVVVAGQWDWPVLLSAVCVMGVFLLRGSVEAWADRLGPQNRWSVLLDPMHLFLATGTAVAAGILLIGYARLQLLGIGLAAGVLYFFQRRLVRNQQPQRAEKRRLPAELLGVVLLTFSAPTAWIAATGSLFNWEGSRPQPLLGLEVWLLNLLFFFGSVLYVKYRVRGVAAHRNFQSLRERVAFLWPVFSYHLLVVIFLASWIVPGPSQGTGEAGKWSWIFVLLAFTPSVVRAHRLVFSLGRGFPISRLGWGEIVHSMVFAALLILGLRFR